MKVKKDVGADITSLRANACRWPSCPHSEGAPQADNSSSSLDGSLTPSHGGRSVLSKDSTV